MIDTVRISAPAKQRQSYVENGTFIRLYARHGLNQPSLSPATPLKDSPPSLYRPRLNAQSFTRHACERPRVVGSRENRPNVFDGKGEYDMLLLRSEWIVDRWRAGGRLERRQELPPEAFYLGKLELRAVVVIS